MPGAQGSTTMTWLDPDKPLADIQMEHMQKLLFRKKPMDGVFGAEAAKLPQTDADPNGFVVPEILFQIKAQLYMSHGLEQRGIFRSTGDAARAPPARRPNTLGGGFLTTNY